MKAIEDISKLCFVPFLCKTISFR